MRVLVLSRSESHVKHVARCCADFAEIVVHADVTAIDLTTEGGEALVVHSASFDANDLDHLLGAADQAGLPVAIADDAPQVPLSFRWRRQAFETRAATGPERIAPEWWLDDPDWRTGVRDYWRVTTASGDRLWLYYAHGAGMSAGWFCHGQFA